MSQDASIPLSDFIHHIHQIQAIIVLITGQHTHGVSATDAQPFTSQLVDANMMSTSIPLSVLMHHIYQIHYFAALITSQYAHHVYNTQPFSGQLGDANIMSTYDPGEGALGS